MNRPSRSRDSVDAGKAKKNPVVGICRAGIRNEGGKLQKAGEEGRRGAERKKRPKKKEKRKTMAEATHGDFLRGFRNSNYALESQSCVSHSPGTGITKAVAKQYGIV